jgi:hypothetical protein
MRRGSKKGEGGILDEEGAPRGEEGDEEAHEVKN